MGYKVLFESLLIGFIGIIYGYAPGLRHQDSQHNAKKRFLPLGKLRPEVIVTN